MFKPEVPSSQHYQHSSCSSIPTAPASHWVTATLASQLYQYPIAPASQHYQHPTASASQLYQHPSNTNMPAEPTPQLNQQPSCTRILAAPTCHQNQHPSSISIPATPACQQHWHHSCARTSEEWASYCFSIPAIPISHSIPVDIQCLTLDSLNTALHFNKYPRICMHISVGEALFLKAQLCKTSRETQGKSG